VAKPTSTSSHPQSTLKSGDMATMRVPTRHRATAIEVKVTALLAGPRSRFGKLQLIEVIFSAARRRRVSLEKSEEMSSRQNRDVLSASRTVQLDSQHCFPRSSSRGSVQKHWMPNLQAENPPVISEVQLAFGMTKR
jgi:hypothetical protein